VAVGATDDTDLDSLRERMGDCQACPLGATRTRLVFGVGDPHARLMFVGEAPGRNEDVQGEPFVGAAGKLLDELLAGIGMSRRDVYIANILKCRPPGNRDPEPEEIETCTPFLARQVALIDPTVIATLGKFATQHVLDTTAPISSLRGQLYNVGGRQVVPIFHPAVALYDSKKKPVLFDDFQRLKAVLDRPEGSEGFHGFHPPRDASRGGEGSRGALGRDRGRAVVRRSRSSPSQWRRRDRHRPDEPVLKGRQR
jgi:uracil-DNA glycosylase family 4